MPKKVCSFCGRGESEVGLLITGLSGNICDQCTQQAYEILQTSGAIDSPKNKGGFKLKKVPKPTEIKKYLDEYIIGQDDGLLPRWIK